MKKRIVAAALAAVLVCGIIGLRPKATGAAVAIGSIGVAAYVVLMTMIQNSDVYDDILASGIDYFTNENSLWYDGWRAIGNQLEQWFNSGEITISDDGVVTMSYSQYLELCDLVGNASADLSVDFNTDIPYICFNANPGYMYDIDQAISCCSFTDLADGMSYSPIFYSEDSVYLSNSYFLISSRPYSSSDLTASVNVELVFANFQLFCNSHGSTLLNGYMRNTDYRDFISSAHLSFGADSQSLLARFYDLVYGRCFSTQSIETDWYLYDGSGLIASTPDLSDMKMAIINCRGSYLDFVKSISSFSFDSSVPELDDLSGVLPLDKTKDPTLEIDTDPSIANPNDAVTVKDVPGTPDMTLSDYKAQTRLDIDIPSVISTKFPFCIPYDLIRILGVFCADPKAPIFHIPISTDPAQLEPFKGNQTVGEIPEDFEPMFEIDEELVIDLSVIPLVQPICYTVFIVGFVLLLIHITPKMINH